MRCLHFHSLAMARRYFVVHGVIVGDFNYERISDITPCVEAVLEFDHFPRHWELRRALANAESLQPHAVKITGWAEVDKDEASAYLEEVEDPTVAAELLPPRYTAGHECTIL